MKLAIVGCTGLVGREIMKVLNEIKIEYTELLFCASVSSAGKEIGYMNIVEKVAAGLSPLIGGIVASLAGPGSAIILSIFLFLLSECNKGKHNFVPFLTEKAHFIQRTGLIYGFQTKAF